MGMDDGYDQRGVEQTTHSQVVTRLTATAATPPMSAAAEPTAPPAVSVLMCAYDAGAFIREAVDSILQQSMKVSE